MRFGILRSTQLSAGSLHLYYLREFRSCVHFYLSHYAPFFQCFMWVAHPLSRNRISFGLPIWKRGRLPIGIFQRHRKLAIAEEGFFLRANTRISPRSWRDAETIVWRRRFGHQARYQTKRRVSGRFVGKNRARIASCIFQPGSFSQTQPNSQRIPILASFGISFSSSRLPTAQLAILVTQFGFLAQATEKIRSSGLALHGAVLRRQDQPPVTASAASCFTKPLSRYPSESGCTSRCF